MNQRGTVAQTYIAMIILAAAFMAVAGLLHPGFRPDANVGLCLPSPNLWPIIPLWSKIINGALIIAVSLWAWFLNKRYNFIKNSDYTLPSLLVLFLGSNPFDSGLLCTSTLLLVFWMIAFSVLFGCYRQRNASQELFLVATFIAIGSMADYAFLTAAPMVIIAAVMLKAMRFREVIAFLMGLVAPYWIGFGFGLLKPDDFHLPQFSNFTNGPLLPAELLTVGAGMGILWLCAAICALGTTVKLYAGNPKPRTFNYTIYLLSVYSVLCMIVDSGHLAAYLSTTYFSIAVMLANFFTLNNVYRTSLWIWIIAGLSALYWGLIMF